MSHENRVLLLALTAGLPGVFVSLILLWSGHFSTKVKWTLTLLVPCVWLICAFVLRERVKRPLQILSNLLAALREGDYSIRAHWGVRDGALHDIMREVNALGDIFREQRLSALEATALLRRVMAKIDVAVFAFDGEERLRLVNHAGERLLAQPSERLLGRTASELRLEECLRASEGGQASTLELTFPGGAGRWEVRRSSFREHGRSHQLLVLSDLSRLLREEERAAWQRLVRVLSHELNNSLAPIASIAESLEKLLLRDPRPADWQQDMQRGLTIISKRSATLSRFIQAYTRLARLPPPRLQRIEIGELIRRAAALETRRPLKLISGPECYLEADPDQLEQLLINLLRNAVDAATETGGGVTISWSRDKFYLEVSIEDEGLGLANVANLFVPFFTTKPGGSGIGLALSRQIAEAHGGALTLANRSDQRGCVALLRLPLNQSLTLSSSISETTKSLSASD